MSSVCTVFMCSPLIAKMNDSFTLKIKFGLNCSLTASILRRVNAL